MKIILIIALIVTGIIFVWSVLLMSPKGWIGFGIWGVSGSNEYGSKKMIESKLKKVAIISIIVFVIIALILPYSK